ncbi:MAG TPA: hypothetical protein PKZ99_04405 [Azospirillaceae bacterium]|nr:hypothetical protein [Azospirillaceae bacterium]
MSDIEVSQAYGELLIETVGPIRVSQTYAETLLTTASAVRVGQVYAELIRSVADKPATAAGGTVVCVVVG